MIPTSREPGDPSGGTEDDGEAESGPSGSGIGGETISVEACPPNARRRWHKLDAAVAARTPELRHAELAKEIAAHDYRYHVLDDPVISDAEYDALYGELRELEAAHPELDHADSPTRRVGNAPRSELRTVPHVAP